MSKSLALAGLTLSAVLLAGTPGFAAEGGMIVVPKDAGFTPAPAILPKGMMIETLQGDPAKPGPFVIRLKMPANTVIAPHTHSKDETVTILSGTIWHEHGETIDKSKGTDLKAGGFVFLPAGMPHSLWTDKDAVEMQVNGTGPFGLNYVNPADDPSAKRS